MIISKMVHFCHFYFARIFRASSSTIKILLLTRINTRAHWRYKISGSKAVLTTNTHTMLK